MTEIDLTPMGPGEYGVQVTEGHTTTSHRVKVPDDLADAGLPEGDPERLVRESLLFLLEREPATAILPEFALPDITRYFPEYPAEIAARLA